MTALLLQFIKTLLINVIASKVLHKKDKVLTPVVDAKEEEL